MHLYKNIPNQFQSTPSPRRETRVCAVLHKHHGISIHSLPKEGDLRNTPNLLFRANFNPLPPQGGRLFEPFAAYSESNFNPLPPQGGRLLWYDICDIVYVFQSTPSPRRETETNCTNYYVIPISIHSLPKEGDISA